MQETAIVWFNEVNKKDIATVGGKGANLGELTGAHIPVPPGFIVTANAYYDFLQKSKLTNKIRNLLKPLEPGNSKQLQQVASQVKRVILDAPMPPKLAQKIKEAYIKMGRGLVAVRSSATAEDLPTASFAGQQTTYLNVQGEKQVVAAVQQCWASLFRPRAIFYRHQQGFDHFKVGIAVPVQRMVQSQVSGVMFTLEPMTSDKTKIVIEAVFGLGETLVSGQVIPDLYIIDKKEGLKISSKKIGKQEWQLIRNPAGDKKTNIKVPLQPSSQTQQKLADDDIISLAKLGKHIEDLYQFPQDIEWAKEGKEIFIVQTRPVTTIKETVAEVRPKIEATVLLSGVAASPGMASGPVKIVDASEIDKIDSGNILVAEMTTPDFVPAMKRAVAAKAFNPRPVVYRTNDFKTNEYRELEGGQEYEEVEENPMLGYRGASRNIRDPDIFDLEIEAIKRVRQNYKNLWVMIPFVRTVNGMAKIKKYLEARGLNSSADFKLWMMVEVPSNIFLMEEFIGVGIDGISIGSNDLTQLILGIDRDSSRLQDIFDERNEAVLVALEKAITTAKSMG